MKNIKLIIENQDVLTEELSNIFGGQTDESTPIVVHCNSDGGCNLRRLEYKISNKPYDLCPIDTANMDTLLDMFYEKEIKN